VGFEGRISETPCREIGERVQEQTRSRAQVGWFTRACTAAKNRRNGPAARDARAYEQSLNVNAK
jgi:hypothetical protein